jgi:hypothetical protein
MWCRLSDLKALQLSVLWVFEIFICSKCSLLLYKRYLLYVVNFVDQVFKIIMAFCITSALRCNPFNESEHNNVRNNLRIILPWMTEKLFQLNTDHKVCNKCNKKISKLKKM